jgi:hypothetical protein
MSLLCRDQCVKIRWLCYGVFALLSCWTTSDSAAQQIRVVPSISVIEQYDSNVFFTPKSLLAPGTKADDFITVVTPQLNFMQSNSLVKSKSVGWRDCSEIRE